MTNFEYNMINNVLPGEILVCTELTRAEDGSLTPRVSFDIVVSNKERRSALKKRIKIASPMYPAYLIGLGVSDSKKLEIIEDNTLKFHFGAMSADLGLRIPCILPTRLADDQVVSEKIIRRAELKEIPEYLHERAKMLAKNIPEFVNW